MPNPKLIAAVSVLLAFAILSTLTMFYRGQSQSWKAKYYTFIAQSQVLAAQQLAENQRKERLYEDMAKKAYADRDTALFKLRHEQSVSRASVVPPVPASAVNADTICFTKSGLDAALRDFTSGVEGLLVEGSQAVIDDKTWAASWPK